MACSFVISLRAIIIGVRYGTASDTFQIAQGLGKLPAIGIAAATAYAMAKSDPKALARQKAFRVFAVVTSVMCIVYFL